MRNAPSQPAGPPSPSYQFEMIAADYFHLDGWNYLVLSDRYSGWISVYRTGWCEYDANRLVEALKEHFISWGVAAECASDIFDEKSAETLCAKTWIECEKLLSTKRNFSRHYLLYHEGRMQLKVILAFPCIVNRD